jgi:hypothetical protein
MEYKILATLGKRPLVRRRRRRDDDKQVAGMGGGWNRLKILFNDGLLNLRVSITRVN